MQTTFKEYVQSHWLPNLHRRQVRPSTLASYHSMLKNHVYPYFDSMTISQVDPPRVELLLSSMSSLSPKYQRNVGLLLQAIFNHAVDSEVLDRSPIRAHHMAICRPQEKPSWTPSQVASILAAIPRKYQLIFHLLALTGMRIGEALALRWQDLHLGARSISIHRSCWRTFSFMDSTKTGVSRTIPMPATLSQSFCHHWACESSRCGALADSDLIFRGDDKRAYSPDFLRREVLYPVLRGLGVPCGDRESGFHRFRHSAGSIIVSKTGNLKLAQTLLGHSSISTTADIYTHVQPAELAGAVGLLEREIMEAST